jgi:hypothetical protein
VDLRNGPGKAGGSHQSLGLGNPQTFPAAVKQGGAFEPGIMPAQKNDAAWFLGMLKRFLSRHA